MIRDASVVYGFVKSFSISERGLAIKVWVDDDRSLVLLIDSQRRDFAAQLQLVQYALSTNEEQDVRAANGFSADQRKQVWVQLPRPMSADWAELTSRGSPPHVRPMALGVAEGDINPFDKSQSSFGVGPSVANGGAEPLDAAKAT